MTSDKDHAAPPPQNLHPPNIYTPLALLGVLPKCIPRGIHFFGGGLYWYCAFLGFIWHFFFPRKFHHFKKDPTNIPKDHALCIQMVCDGPFHHQCSRRQHPAKSLRRRLWFLLRGAEPGPAGRDFVSGVRRFDGALGGMGGCPYAASALTGNVATETLISFCNTQGLDPGLDAKSLAHAEVWATAAAPSRGTPGRFAGVGGIVCFIA